MGIMVRERPHESALMDIQKRDYVACRELEPELQLPCGWEKCLDLKSGLIYFKDWNSGTMTYRDPRQVVRVATQRIGLLSISLPAESNAREGDETATTSSSREEEEAEEEGEEEDRSLELSLTLPGCATSVVAGESVCTMEKVRSALERSHWLHRPAASLKRRTPRRAESNSPRHSSASSSHCSSDCFTSPSIMSYEGDEEEVQQRPRLRGDNTGAKSMESGVAEVMVAVGCRSCLMYVMLSKAHPSCPKCGNTDVLLELPVPLPKKRRVSSSSWSWCAA